MSKTFYRSAPTYCVISGDDTTDVTVIETAMRRLFKSVIKSGRNPVFFGINGNACSEMAGAIATEYKVPVKMGTVAELMGDLQGRRLKGDNIQVLLFQTPEYAGSKECLDILSEANKMQVTLRMWSNWHNKWLNCAKSKPWVRSFNNKFLEIAGRVYLTCEQKSQELARKMMMLRRYPPKSLYINEETPATARA